MGNEEMKVKKTGQLSTVNLHGPKNTSNWLQPILRRIFCASNMHRQFAWLLWLKSTDISAEFLRSLLTVLILATLPTYGTESDHLKCEKLLFLKDSGSIDFLPLSVRAEKLNEQLSSLSESHHSQDPFKLRPNPSDWRYAGKDSLLKHIVSAHFQARTLRGLGVALFDIEIAAYKGFDMSYVVERAWARILRTDVEIQNEIDGQTKVDGSKDVFTPDDYRTVLIKNLKLIQIFDGASVDLNSLLRLYPHLAAIPIDLKRDTRDGSFLNIFRQDLDPSRVRILEEKKERLNREL